MLTLKKLRRMTEKAYQELCARAGISSLASSGKAKAHKYNAVKKIVDGITFDSAGEARAGSLLMLWEKAGAISNLERQPRYTLMDGYVDPGGRRVRSMEYVPDFPVHPRRPDGRGGFQGRQNGSVQAKGEAFPAAIPRPGV